MLKKIFRIQKSYRITVEIDEKITILSSYLNRPQNDIINLALEKFFQEDEIKVALNDAYKSEGAAENENLPTDTKA